MEMRADVVVRALLQGVTPLMLVDVLPRTWWRKMREDGEPARLTVYYTYELYNNALRSSSPQPRCTNPDILAQENSTL